MAKTSTRFVGNTVIKSGTCTVTNIEYEVTVDREAYDNWKNKGMYIQDAFPNLSPDWREFLMTGITPAEWNKMFPPEEE